MLNLFTADFSLRITYSPLIEVSINGHLLTGHCVQGETRRYFSHTFRTFGDNDKVYRYQNDKHDKTDNRITADNEVTKSGNYLSGIPVQQYQTGRGYVKRQPEQSGYQQQRRENGQVQGLFVVDYRHHQQKSHRDVQTDKHIQQQRRQGNNHHDNDGNDSHRYHDIAVFLNETALAENIVGGSCLLCSHSVTPLLLMPDGVV